MQEVQNAEYVMQKTRIMDFCFVGERRIRARSAPKEAVHIVQVVCEMVHILFIVHRGKNKI